MNILLVSPHKKSQSGDYQITADQYHHLVKTLKVEVGQNIFAGEIGGKMGHSPITEITSSHITLRPNFDTDPPTAPPIKLVIALPRPKMLKRILRSVSMLGVKEIYLINTYKVEKSFWQTQVLQNKYYERYFHEGLTQAKDTIMPSLKIYKKFKPFVEDELPKIIQATTPIVAHPGNYPKFPQGINSPMTLVIGPEGGFTEYEVNLLRQNGMSVYQCGERILRMETAVTALISQHYSFLN